MTETATRAKSAPKASPEPTRVTPASASFANYIRAQGHDISAEAVALTFRYHQEWQKSPERAAERDSEKAERQAAREESQGGSECRARRATERREGQVGGKACQARGEVATSRENPRPERSGVFCWHQWL